MANLLQRLFRLDDPAAASPPPAGDTRVGDVEVFFLLDTASLLDRQLLLLSVDALSHFGGAGQPLPVTVVHGGEIDRQAARWLDAAPGLACRHRALAEVVAPAQERSMGHRWREFAALAVARMATARFYLVLDESCLCVRPMPLDLLVQHGKALTQWETLGRHPASLDASNQLLSADLRHGESISTLPSVLNTELVLRTLKRIAAKPAQADAALAAASQASLLWTANSLYSVACQSELGSHHLQQEETGRFMSLHGDANIWGDDDDLSGWDPVQWTRQATHGQFLVVKSARADRARKIASRSYAFLS